MSRAAQPFKDEDLFALLQKSRANRSSVSDSPECCSTKNGDFIQMLEGQKVRFKR
jgi:hypothetical protein